MDGIGAIEMLELIGLVFLIVLFLFSPVLPEMVAWLLRIGENRSARHWQRAQRRLLVLESLLLLGLGHVVMAFDMVFWTP